MYQRGLQVLETMRQLSRKSVKRRTCAAARWKWAFRP